MDLVSLIAACSFGAFDPEITRAVVTLSSYGEPWSYRIEGEPNAKVFQTPEAAIAGARQAQELGKAVRVGLAGSRWTSRRRPRSPTRPCSRPASI